MRIIKVDYQLDRFAVGPGSHSPADQLRPDESKFYKYIGITSSDGSYSWFCSRTLNSHRKNNIHKNIVSFFFFFFRRKKTTKIKWHICVLSHMFPVDSSAVLQFRIDCLQKWRIVKNYCTKWKKQNFSPATTCRVTAESNEHASFWMAFIQSFNARTRVRAHTRKPHLNAICEKIELKLKKKIGWRMPPPPNMEASSFSWIELQLTWTMADIVIVCVCVRLSLADMFSY